MSSFKEVLNVPNTLVSAVPGGLLLQTFVYNREGHASNIQFTQIPCSEQQAEVWIKENCKEDKISNSIVTDISDLVLKVFPELAMVQKCTQPVFSVMKKTETGIYTHQEYYAVKQISRRYENKQPKEAISDYVEFLKKIDKESKILYLMGSIATLVTLPEGKLMISSSIVTTNEQLVKKYHSEEDEKQITVNRMYGNPMDYKTINGLYRVLDAKDLSDFQDDIDDEVTACTNAAVELPNVICISKNLAKKLNLIDCKTVETVLGKIALRIL